MNIKITNKPVEIPTEVYKLHITAIGINRPYEHELTNIETLHNYIKITAKYIQLLNTDHSEWCDITADTINQVAELIDVEITDDDIYKIFPYRQYHNCIARPTHYWVTYVDKSGIEYQCDVEQELKWPKHYFNKL